jgi:hypothetical protein
MKKGKGGRKERRKETHVIAQLYKKKIKFPRE